MEYTAVIRTLGRAGDKYQILLNSLCSQTIPPQDIIVYIAEGYDTPNETCGKEKYVFVKKGMVAQRALTYDEVSTGYILFLDDDVYLPTNGVECLFSALKDKNADVVSPDVFPNHERSLKGELLMTLSGRMRGRRGDHKWAYKVMRTGGYSYNKTPKTGSYLSQTNAGPCFLCRKEDFLKIHFEDELWIDRNSYPIGEDQVMYYKMHLMGLKQITLFGSGIMHLDAGSTQSQDLEKEEKLIKADFFFKRVFWHRFFLTQESSFFKRLWSRICIEYAQIFGLFISMIKGNQIIYSAKKAGILEAKKFIQSKEYKSLETSFKH